MREATNSSIEQEKCIFDMYSGVLKEGRMSLYLDFGGFK
jgi:hypothetical protein